MACWTIIITIMIIIIVIFLLKEMGLKCQWKWFLRMGLAYQIIEEDINILDYQKMSRLAWHFKVVPNIRF